MALLVPVPRLFVRITGSVCRARGPVVSHATSSPTAFLSHMHERCTRGDRQRWMSQVAFCLAGAGLLLPVQVPLFYVPDTEQFRFFCDRTEYSMFFASSFSSEDKLFSDVISVLSE